MSIKQTWGKSDLPYTGNHSEVLPSPVERGRLAVTEAETGPGADLMASPGPHWHPCAGQRVKEKCLQTKVCFFVVVVV